MGFDLKRSLGTRLFIIAFLTLILLIPAVLIQSLIYERQERRDEAAGEISSKWGERQVVSGPILSIPYKFIVKEANNTVSYSRQYIHILPEDLNIKASIDPQVRYRGIYEVVVYNSSIVLDGSFTAMVLEELKIPEEDILWDEAIIALGISDMKGIKEFVEIVINKKGFNSNPGVETKDVVASGISINPTLSGQDEKLDFHIEMNLNGSGGLYFCPVGKQTRVRISGNWSSPSYDGEFLPTDRTMNDGRFDAQWKVLNLNRNFPQMWLGAQHKIEPSAFGVNLLLPVDEYQKTMRTAKYAIMFISLTFLTFFMIELLSKKTIHPIQYLLIGFALLVFYTLLLSLSEHLVFKYAYLVASVAIIVMISLYTTSVLVDKTQTFIISGILIILYGYLYIVLQLEDFALLMGSIALFVVLAVVMYLTRKIDWFEIMSNGRKSRE